MVEHIVLLKLKPTTTEEHIQIFTQALLKMAEKYPGLWRSLLESTPIRKV